MRRDQDQRGSRGRLLALALGVVAMASMGVTVGYFSQHLGGFWGGALLSLSTIFCFLLACCAWVRHEGALTRLAIVFCIFEIVKILLTLEYSSMAATEGFPWSLISLVVVVFVVIGSSLLTRQLLQAPENPSDTFSRWSEWTRDLARVPFLTLLSYMFILMYAMYFLSFALAFHDKSREGPGLHVVPVQDETPALDLLDYMYFMVYTITTTGYGDLRPLSPYTKFLTTIANLFEVYFLVIVGNVLIVFSTTNASWSRR